MKSNDSSTAITLRPVAVGDEDVVRSANVEMAAEGFTFAFGLKNTTDFADYLRELGDRRQDRGEKNGVVPETFLLAEADGAIVGRLSLRHRLDDKLREKGGHIGFGVLPGHRRRGYATQILREALNLARKIGLQQVLVTCSEQNLGSRSVIEALGGVYRDSTTQPDGAATRRYWIGLGNCHSKVRDVPINGNDRF